jgi:hypothetical protein
MNLQMELEFDKEIDAMLRGTPHGSSTAAASRASGHLDADELAAFAEKALPDLARRRYVAHLADCDRCRKTLSGFIAMQPEAARAAAFAAAGAPIPSAALPWYRSFLAKPNLAYTMATIVVLFSGFIGYVVWQNQLAVQNAELAQIADEPAARRAPVTGDRQDEFSNTATTANSAANANGGSSIDSVTKSGVAVGTTNTTSTEEDREVARNEAPVKETGPMTRAEPQPQPPPKDALVTTDRDMKVEQEKQPKAAEKKTEKVAALTDGTNVARSDAQLGAGIQSPALKPLPQRAAGPRQTNTQMNQSQINNLPLGTRSNSELSSVRTAGGKKFEFRNGVWYDTSYAGQGTKSIKRGTEKFLRLDEGLRSIANAIGGTVVVIWNGKAYKIR